LPPPLHFPLRYSCTFRCAAATADAAATKVTAFNVIITATAIVAHVQHMLDNDNGGVGNGLVSEQRRCHQHRPLRVVLLERRPALPWLRDLVDGDVDIGGDGDGTSGGKTTTVESWQC
jgi:hypothetical protein